MLNKKAFSPLFGAGTAVRRPIVAKVGILGSPGPGFWPLSDIELRVLGDFAQSRRRPRPASLQAAVREVAILGGYTNRNHDPPPGWPPTDVARLRQTHHDVLRLYLER